MRLEFGGNWNPASHLSKGFRRLILTTIKRRPLTAREIYRCAVSNHSEEGAIEAAAQFGRLAKRARLAKGRKARKHAKERTRANETAS